MVPAYGGLCSGSGHHNRALISNQCGFSHLMIPDLASPGRSADTAKLYLQLNIK